MLFRRDENDGAPAQPEPDAPAADDASSSQEDKDTIFVETIEEDEPISAAAKKKMMQLNEAFEALNGMRKANLEWEFHGIPNVDKSMLDQYCTECLREEKNNPRQNGRFSFISNRFRKGRSPSACCMVCAAPVCERHACQGHELHLCEGQCKPLLSPEVLLERLESLGGAERTRFVDHMMESYDRSLLLLQYVSQYEDLNELAESLENNTRTNTHIRLSGSGMGFMAGVTGVGAMAAPAATAAHITAAASLAAISPPLLVASLVLGCTGACTTLGHELAIHKFYKNSDVQVRYHKLVAWASVVKTIALVAEDLKTKIEAKKVTAIVIYQPPQANPFEEALRHAEANPKNYKTRESEMTERTEALTDWNDETSSVDSNGSGDEDKLNETFQDEFVDDMPLLELVEQSEETEEEEANENTYDLTEFSDEVEIFGAKQNDDAVKAVTGRPEFEDLLDDVDRALDKSKRGEQETALDDLDKGKKHPLSFLVPLFPLADDVVLTASRVLADPNAGARLALANAAKVAQYASVACGALSAFTIAFEGNNIRNNLKVLEEGCDKAHRIRNLYVDLQDMPSTDAIADTFHEYLQVMATA